MNEPTSETAAAKGRRRKLSQEEMRDATRFLDEWRQALMRDDAISNAAFRAGYALSLRVDWLTFEGFPSQETIAADIGATDRTVREAFKVLEAAGYITAKRRKQTSKLYRLDLPNRKKTTVLDCDQERKKAADQESRNDISDTSNSSGLSESLTGNFSYSRPEKNGAQDRKKSVVETGKKQPPIDIQERHSPNDIPERHGAVATAARSGAHADAPSPRSLPEIPQSSAGSLTRQEARSPAEEEKLPAIENSVQILPKDEWPEDDEEIDDAQTERQRDRPADDEDLDDVPF